MKTINLNYKNYNGPVSLKYGKYGNGNIALQLFTVETSQCLLTATINLVDYNIEPEEGNLIIKHYSENSGLLEALEEAGFIKEKLNSFSFGFVENGATEIVIADEYKP